MKIRIPREHVTSVFFVRRHHVGTSADRPPGEPDTVLLKSRIRVERFGLPRDRGEEAHREPVLELRVLAPDPDHERMRVGSRDTVLGEWNLPQIKKRRMVLSGILSPDGVPHFAEPDDVGGKR